MSIEYWVRINTSFKKATITESYKLPTHVYENDFWGLNMRKHIRVLVRDIKARLVSLRTCRYHILTYKGNNNRPIGHNNARWACPFLIPVLYFIPQSGFDRLMPTYWPGGHVGSFPWLIWWLVFIQFDQLYTSEVIILHF